MFATAPTLWRLHPGTVAPLTLQFPLTIGRQPSSNLRLPDDDVSRAHAILESREGRLVISDQGSRNGIYVDGRRVGVSALSPRSVLRMGQTVLWLGPALSFQARLETVLAEEASKTTPLLLVGEQGAGKRTIARELHRRSKRPGALLVVEGALDEHLWRMASGGTVLCEARGDFERLCAEAEKHHVRLFGTEVSPSRLAVPTLAVPPLRERLDELPGALARLLGHAASGWNADFFEALACHPFPLNFTELEVLCRGIGATNATVEIQQLSHAVRAHVVEARSATTTEELSRERLHDTLTRHKGNVRRVAQELGVQRGQLYRVLAGVGLNPDLYRGLATPADAASPNAGDERRTLS